MTTDAQYRADRARELLDDPVLADAFAAIERACIEAVLADSASDDERRRAADRANAVRWLKAELQSVVTRAKLEARNKAVVT